MKYIEVESKEKIKMCVESVMVEIVKIEENVMLGRVIK